MSRIPHRQTPSTKSSLALPPSRSPRAPSPNKSAASSSTPSPRLRTKSAPKPPQRNAVDTPPPTPKTPANLRDAIALRRAEIKKAKATVNSTSGNGGEDPGLGFDDFPSAAGNSKQDDSEDVAELGRWTIRETIERARNSGNLNLSLRSLQCIPSALFEIHLSIKPDPLSSVPNEPPLPDPAPSKRARTQSTRGASGPAWFEAQDLVVLKAGGNDIQEIQQEISLFGSLKTVDLHQNKLISLPATFADLSQLTSLDLSHNALKSLPSNLFALPYLVTLNIAHNALSTLPFSAPFSSANAKPPTSRAKSSFEGGLFGSPAPVRAEKPLPALQILDISFNKLSAEGIDNVFPENIIKLDLSANALGSKSESLVLALARLEKLTELKLEESDIEDDAFVTIQTGKGSKVFPKLKRLDLGKTKVTQPVMEHLFTGRDISFDWVANEPEKGQSILQILLGTKVLKEAWEIEAERRGRGGKFGAGRADAGPLQKDIAKEARSDNGGEVLKEAWEIEAEQGLLTEGGRRRARLAAAAASNSASASKQPSTPSPSQSSSATPSSPPSAPSLANTPYYSASTQTLTLPPSQPAPRQQHGHARAFSTTTIPRFNASPSLADLAVPTPTLPLSVVCNEPFAQTLRVLILANRRLDTSFTLPPLYDMGVLPKLEELDLEGCALGDNVPVSTSEDTGRKDIPVLPLLCRLFPSLRVLNLSFNTFTSSTLSTSTLSQLLLADPATARKGLTHLRLRGNRVVELEGFAGVADLFRGNRQVSEWTLEELDLRDNEIGKLPPKLGLLPLDVFLVDGNVFRIPARRIWEREGTKGLLSWLRGRIDDS